MIKQDKFVFCLILEFHSKTVSFSSQRPKIHPHDTLLDSAQMHCCINGMKLFGPRKLVSGQSFVCLRRLICFSDEGSSAFVSISLWFLLFFSDSLKKPQKRMLKLWSWKKRSIIFANLIISASNCRTFFQFSCNDRFSLPRGKFWELKNWKFIRMDSKTNWKWFRNCFWKKKNKKTSPIFKTPSIDFFFLLNPMDRKLVMLSQ